MGINVNFDDHSLLMPTQTDVGCPVEGDTHLFFTGVPLAADCVFFCFEEGRFSRLGMHRRQQLKYIRMKGLQHKATAIISNNQILISKYLSCIDFPFILIVTFFCLWTILREPIILH